MSVVSAVVELVYAGNPHSASVLAATAAAAGWDGRLGAAEGDRVRLAEGPLWEASTDTLYFIDILGKKLHALHIAAAEAAGDKPAVSGHREWTLPELPGTVCLTEKSGVLLVAMQDGLYLFDTHTGQCVHSGVDCEPGVGANRCNDGKVDPSGRLVVGTMCLDEGPEGQHKGGLYSVDGSRGEWTSRRLLSGLSIPNGLAWTRDGATFFHTDTPARLIKRYAYDAATGEVGEGQPAIQLTEEFGAGPDGLTIDEEDKLWVASWSAHSTHTTHKQRVWPYTLCATPCNSASHLTPACVLLRCVALCALAGAAVACVASTPRRVRFCSLCLWAAAT